MNIGIDITALQNNSTGVGKYIKNILDELQRIDAENRYVLFDCKGADYTPTNPDWIRISKKSKLPGTAWLLFILPRLLKKHNIDVLWSPAQICPVLLVPRRLKIVTTVHDFVMLRYPETCLKSDLLIKRALCPPSFRRSDGLTPVSDCIKDELLDNYPYLRSARKIIKTVNNGVSDNFRADRSVQRENYLFFPGNLEPRKNLQRLIKALEIVNASGFDLNLHICGPKGWRNSDFHKLVETSPVRNKIKHLGYISDAELLDRYLKCKALIYPSIYEGFGIPVLEALKLGTPVLTSKGTVMEEIAGENAAYFDPCDTASIATAIIAFLKNGGTSINQESLKRYSWKRSSEDLLNVFNEVMSAPTARH